jgi:N6-adenosine-specific RNA methylase IME4
MSRDLIVFKVDQARALLAQAKTASQAKAVADLARAAEVFAKRQQLSEEVIAHATAIRVDALTLMGKFLKASPKATGTKGRLRSGPGRGRKNGGVKVEPPFSEPPPTYRELGIGKKEAADAQLLATLPAKVRDTVREGTDTLANVKRKLRQADARARMTALKPPDGLFDVLVIDPPWPYDRQPADSGMRGEVDYATLSLDELRAHQLPAAADCVLWLWTTNSFMCEAYDLAYAWHFTPKTILTWDKVTPGLGHWLRNVTEHCLLAVKGHPPVQLTTQSTLLREARREHSRKPEAFYTLVDSLCLGRKLDYFGRTPRAGWNTYGLESDRFAAAASV